MNRTKTNHKIVESAVSSKFNRKNKMFLKGFIEYLYSIDRSERTIKGYKNDIEIFFTWNYICNRNKSFTRLRKMEIAAFQNYALTKWQWSPNRIARVKSVLSSLSNYIENILDDEIKDYHPVVNKIPSPPIQNVLEPTVISDKEIDETLDKLVADHKYQAACMFALAAFSGSRRAELLQFKVNWFSSDNIIPGTSLYVTPEKIRTKGKGKLGKPIYKFTLQEFKKYYDLWMAERERRNINCEYLFVGRNGTKATDSQIQSCSNTISRYVNKPFYFHCLRHQLCSRLKRRGVPADVIQLYFGWESVKMVEVYNDCNAAEVLAKYFIA
ncbi:tyrosine-type recombinase/integrase [Butyrivibrio sp. NC2002]|uniref:tyrosine-type recombinase/integrase n=1 Tax=Butyrivibrio sp. NC2002 TaxID=1410610 RepID=UPI0006907615|nr:site-specific integrase [Butyrivibrio sp. NC2002]